MSWTARVRIPSWEHQVVGTERLLNAPSGLIPGVVAVFDEVGVGKSKQQVDAAQEAHERRLIDTVVVVAPGFARPVWASPNPLLGEVAKHGWDSKDNIVQEFRSGGSDISWGKYRDNPLQWVVTNYEFIRREERLQQLMGALGGRKPWLVCDESWSIKNHKADQTKAVTALRKMCHRASILNGTPADESPMDLYSQFALLDKRILGYPNFYAFRAAHAVMGGFQKKQIISYRNLEHIVRLTKPYVLRRTTRDCLDLPPVLPEQTIYAPLKPETWKNYLSMRDDLCVFLDEICEAQASGVSGASMSSASQAGVRFLRMQQMLSGYLGGVIDVDEDGIPISDPRTVEIGSEKSDAVMEWLKGNRPEKFIIWCQFRPELQRMAAMLAATGRWDVHKIYGQQDWKEREAAISALAPGGTSRPTVVVGNAQAGGAGLNFSGAHLGIYLSQNPSLRVRKQADGRLDRPGQKHPVQYVNVIACGPNGQRTYDHIIVVKLIRKEDVAALTHNEWRQMLRNDAPL